MGILYGVCFVVLLLLFLEMVFAMFSGRLSGKQKRAGMSMHRESLSSGSQSEIVIHAPKISHDLLRVDGWMHVHMDVWMDGWMDVWIYVWMDGWK